MTIQLLRKLCVFPLMSSLGLILSAGMLSAQDQRGQSRVQRVGQNPYAVRPPYAAPNQPAPGSRGMLSTRGVPPQPTPAFPSYMKVRVDENLVTANVRTTPLQQVLQEIADRTGLVFEVQSQDDPPISINLFRVRIQEAVERIVASDNSIFYYGKDASQQSRIEFVRVFPRINQPQQPSLIYIGTGAITKSGNDTVDSPEDALKVLTDSQNLEARQKAVEVLVAAKGELATLALTAALLDPAPEVRVAAIEGLASLGAHSALPGIIQSLKDKHPGVRQSAITAVALMGDSESIKELKPLSKDRDVSVAAAAEEAIRTLSSARRP